MDEAPKGSGAAPPAAVLERFRAMLREREEVLRAAGEVGVEEAVPPPSAGEVVRMYRELLGELTFNSKPVITELTIIAGEHPHAAEGIARTICERVLHVSEDQKLPSLYLLDSIVKNIGREYVRYFAGCLAEVFCEAYNQVHPKFYPPMRHLYGTWSQIFPSSVLRHIEEELEFPTSGSHLSAGSANTRHAESSSPCPSHGIHINPKYLEARRHFEHSAPDIQHGRAGPSSLQLCGPKPSLNYIEYEVDHPDLSPSSGFARGGSPRIAARHMSSTGKEGRLLYSKGKVLQSSSLSSFGLRRCTLPLGGPAQRGIAPVRVVERPFSSHFDNEYGLTRMSYRNGLPERSRPSYDRAQQSEGSTVYNLNMQHRREMSDAYGNNRMDNSYYEKLPKVRRLDVNGIDSESVTRTCKNSEEEVYAWEDMSPTLTDQSRGNSSPSGFTTASVSRRNGLGREGTTLLESDFTRRIRPSRVELPPVYDPTINTEERIHILHSDHETLNKNYLDDTGYQNESLLPYHASHYAQDPWKLPHGAPLSHPNPSLPFMEARLAPSFGPPFGNALHREVPYSRLPRYCYELLDMDATTVRNHLTERYSPPALSSNPIYPHQKQFRSPFDFVESNMPPVQEVNSSSYLPQQKYDVVDRRPSNMSKMLELPYQQSGFVHVSLDQGNIVGNHSQKVNENLALLAPNQREPTQLSSHVAAQSLNPIQTNVQGSVTVPLLPISYDTSDSILQVGSGATPNLLPGPTPASQMGPSSQNTSSIAPAMPVSAFSGLINSLIEKGLISLTPPASFQDSLGVEFDADFLKVRHESTINALYDDLPRQCTTCGLRFMFRGAHSNHMDWHVTKNRISKNCKQNTSRKWFVSAKEWLCGAETLGTEVVPGFMPTEAVPEKEVKELVVPADENQNICALCGEPFEDFYSDVTEEWMYRGAVYSNAPDGCIEGLERSQLGPIVHAVCRSESNEGLGEA